MPDLVAPLTPLPHKVLIAPDRVPSQTASGLHLVEHWQAEQTGRVIAFGLDCACDAAKVGDRVIFAPTAGQEVLLNRGEPDESVYLLLRDEDLLAVLEESDV